MKGNKVREFLQQRAIKAGAVVLASALVLTSSSWSGIFRNEPEFVAEAELPVYVDPDDSPIPPEPVPSGPSAPKVTKTTKTNKTTKKVKLKAKSKKTYTKKGKAQKKTTTSKKVTSTETTTIKTETTTSLTSKFTKGSNINTQTTTVTTVTTTTVQTNSPASGAVVVSSVQTSAPAVSAGQVQIGSIAPMVDRRVASAYTTLGFTINIDPNVNYSGVCDARTRSITLKKSGDTVYHELGHFLAFVAGNVDKSQAFNQVFAQEKDKYTEYNKAYVLQNSSEYFAESFKNYTMNPGGLRASRPMTYAAIESALNSITDAQVAKVKTVYGAVWGA